MKACEVVSTMSGLGSKILSDRLRGKATVVTAGGWYLGGFVATGVGLVLLSTVEGYNSAAPSTKGSANSTKPL